METKTITVRIWIKHLWLLKAINIALLLMGFEPWVPGFFIGTEIE